MDFKVGDLVRLKPDYYGIKLDTVVIYTVTGVDNHLLCLDNSSGYIRGAYEKLPDSKVLRALYGVGEYGEEKES